MRALIFDPFAGISGDMILGGLVDLGLDPDWLRGFVAGLRLGDVRVEVGRATRRGIACATVRFVLPPEHRHRHLADVLAVVEGSGAPRPVRDRAAAVFRRLAEAEAQVHGIPVEAVHFHEVGALDAILDVLCAVAGVAELGFERCYTRPIALGSGWVEMEHGRFPVPAPATLELLQGLPVRDTGLSGECTTPTGAAILATLVDGRVAPTDYVVLGTGYGAGTRDPEDRPNCLRLVAAEVAAPAGTAVYLVQADVDDLVPEYVPAAEAALREAGALDVVVHPLTMKKGRPGLRIEALAPEPALEPVFAALFRSTTTIGARYWPAGRRTLERAEERVDWRGHSVRIKRVRLPDGTRRAKAEYEDVLRAARALGIAPWQVRSAVEAAAGEEADRPLRMKPPGEGGDA